MLALAGRAHRATAQVLGSSCLSCPATCHRSRGCCRRCTVRSRHSRRRRLGRVLATLSVRRARPVGRLSVASRGGPVGQDHEHVPPR